MGSLSGSGPAPLLCHPGLHPHQEQRLYSETDIFGSRLALLPADNQVGYKTIIESYNNLYNIAIYFIVKINYYAFPYC